VHRIKFAKYRYVVIKAPTANINGQIGRTRCRHFTVCFCVVTIRLTDCSNCIIYFACLIYRHSCESLLKYVFPGWASIVEGNSEVRIHSIATCENHVLFHSDTDTVLANWVSSRNIYSSVLTILLFLCTFIALLFQETDYDCKDDSVWYGTDVVLTGKKVRNFQVFASFTIRGGKIIKIDQRSDSVIKKLGIEAEVLAYRAAQGSSDSQA
jgi:hypothetical protein